jgi:hypothetical protein
MQSYGKIAFALALFLLAGAAFPNSNDKELIIRLQGEVLVLQRLIRDLQESVDKWQVKSEASLNKLGSTADSSASAISSIEDKLQRNQGSQPSTIAGVNNHLARISDQVANNNQTSNEYSSILSRYPRGDKAPAAMFGKGISLLRLEKRPVGVEALKSLLAAYPDSREAAKARAELARLGEPGPGPSSNASGNSNRQRH